MQHKPRKLHVNIQYLATKIQLFFFNHLEIVLLQNRN